MDLSDFNIDFEAEFEEEREETEQNNSNSIGFDFSDFEKVNCNNLFEGDVVSGIPQARIFENEDRASDNLSIRLINEEEEKIYNMSIPVPKTDMEGKTTKIIRKGFSFYRPAFDIILSALYLINPNNIMDANGNEVNKFNKVNLDQIVNFINSFEWLSVEICDGADDSEYNSYMIKG